ncbi:hypothetical protein [uncultured Agrococcus sp.]|uniref:hypothetical protein n=1 Tax=uncultured Agrococcus sp. TaxID=382258 RepID=UPI0025D1DE48|nr:hypothetical protein [uncultured Agrococcus sp.]
MTGMLIATYVRPTGSSTVSDVAATEPAAAALLERQERRGARERDALIRALLPVRLVRRHPHHARVVRCPG